MQEIPTMKFEFARNDEEMRQMAVFVAQLVKEGVKFIVRQDSAAFSIELTGGY